MGCQNCQKEQKFARFCKNHNSEVVVSQKVLYWKVGSLLYVKCAWFCSQKHKTACLSSIIYDFTGCWKCDRFKKLELWLKNPFLQSYIFWTMLLNTSIPCKSENMGRNGANFQKHDNFDLPASK